ncbi:MAG: hypothetical protein DWI64_08010 [Chloroflexi bacterium]|nr:MAG: hypothetical protein DWI64_08010 [Chloroflexota bacterium]
MPRMRLPCAVNCVRNGATGAHVMRPAASANKFGWCSSSGAGSCVEVGWPVALHAWLTVPA